MIVYIASPYSDGDRLCLAAREQNVARSITIAQQVIAAGHIPLNPLLLHYHDRREQNPYETWIRISQAMLEISDVVLKCGISRGVEREARIAFLLSIPVVTRVEDLQ